MDIDKVIADGVAEQAETTEAPVAEVETTNETEALEITPDAITEDEQKPEEAQEPSAEGDEQDENRDEKKHPVYPELDKKAARVIERRDKKINKLSQKLDQEQQQKKDLLERLERLEQQVTSVAQPENKGVNPDEFDNYEDYIREVVKQENTNAFEEQKKATLEAQKAEEQQLQMQQQFEAQVQDLGTKAAEVVKQHSDAAEIFQEHQDVLEALPADHEQIMLSLPNPAQAVYMMAKEGTLDMAAKLHPTVFAAEALDAYKRYGSASSQQAGAKTITNAPKPMRGAKATGASSTKRLEDMSVEDTLKWVKGHK